MLSFTTGFAIKFAVNNWYQTCGFLVVKWTESFSLFRFSRLNIQAQRQTDVSAKEAERKQKEEQKKIDSAMPLTEEEQNEKTLLLTQVITFQNLTMDISRRSDKLGAQYFK